MSRLAVVALAALVVGGCSMSSSTGARTQLLAEADAAAERGDYERALHEYDTFLAQHPDDGAAPRVLASRDAVAAVVTTRAELANLRRDLAVRDAELAKLRDELARTREELGRTRDELARARSDLERLKEIDLKPERPR